MSQSNITTLDILIPCHNRAKDIEKLINHLYKMQCPSNIKFEIHVIDDLSSDNSVEIIKKLQNEHQSLFLIKNKENKGLFLNRIILTTNINADFIFFMDDDDEVEDNLFLEFSKYTDYDLIRTIRKFVTNGNAKIYYELVYPQIKSTADMINLMPSFFITGIFISKYVYTKMFIALEKLRLNFLNLNVYEDQPYFYLMANFARNFKFIKSYYFYLFNPNGLIQSSNFKKIAVDSLRIWDILNKLIVQLKENNSYHITADSMLFELWHLAWIANSEKADLKFLYQQFKKINFKNIPNLNLKTKIKIFLLKHYLTFYLITCFVKPILKMR